MRRDIPIEIFVPTEGLHYDAPPAIITARSSPNLRANAYYGVVQKEYGTSLYATGTVPGVPSQIFEALFHAGPALEVFTATGMYKHSAGAGTFVADGQTYTGTFQNFWSACMHNDAMFYTNGVDLVQTKPAISATGTAWGAVTASSYKAHVVLSFKEHLCLYNVTEAGSESPKRIRWTKVGLLGNTASDFTTGTANFLDVQDVEGEILNALPIAGGVVAVYGAGTVHLQEWVGGTSVFLVTKMLENIQIPSARAIVANDAVHYILTRDNIYEYKGGRSISPIGDAVKTNLFGEVNQDYLNTAFLDYYRDADELRVHIPTTGTLPDTVYICKIKDNFSWFKINREATAAGRSKTTRAITIGELVGNIGAQTWRFGALLGSAQAAVYLNATPSGHITQKDVTRHSHIISGTSAAQTFLFDTKALSSINDLDPIVRDKFGVSKYKDNVTRWLQATIEARGYGSLAVEYSTNEGASFQAFDESPKVLTSTWQMYYFDCDVAAPTFMVRVANSGLNETASIDYVKAELVPGPDRI